MTDHDALLLARLKAVADDLLLKGHPIMAECVEDARAAIREDAEKIKKLQSELSAAQAEASAVQEECAKACKLRSEGTHYLRAEYQTIDSLSAEACESDIRALQISPESGREILRDAELWRKWSKIICDLQEHNFPHQHTFSSLRLAMQDTAPKEERCDHDVVGPHLTEPDSGKEVT